MIAWTAFVTGQAGASLHFDRSTGVIREAEDEAQALGRSHMRRTRPMTGFADGNRRIRLVRGVQAKGMEGMREVFALKLVAADAYGFTDRFRVCRRPRIFGDMSVGEAWRYSKQSRSGASIAAREIGRRKIAGELFARLLGECG